MKEVVISGPWLLILAVFVLWMGKAITSRVAVLSKYSIPLAVTGGLVFSLGVLAVQKWGGLAITFDLEIRDSLLIVFFSTIRISAKFSRLAVGGKALAILTAARGFNRKIRKAAHAAPALWRVSQISRVSKL